MRTDTQDIQLLLELYADGEIDEQDRAEAEKLLESDPAAREYLLALREMRDAVAMPIEHELESIRFEGLFDRVMAQVDATEASAAEARNPELEMLAMAYADGEIADALERDRIEAYVDAHPGAQEGMDAIREIGELTRMPIEMAADTVDFDALARRIDSAVGPEIEAAGGIQPAQPTGEERAGFLQRMATFFGAHRAVFASAIASAVVVAVMVPLLMKGQQPATPDATETPGGEVVEIHNHYYGAESVDYEDGYWGSSQQGDFDNDVAPVIWIAPEVPSKLHAEPSGEGSSDNTDDIPL